jgi:hypothetical protein
MEVNRVDDLRGRRKGDGRPPEIAADLEYVASRGELGQPTALVLRDCARDLLGEHERPVAPPAARSKRASDEFFAGPRHQRRSLFDSMSNHIANRVNCDPKISSSATSTTVATDTALPMIRSTTSAIPSPSPMNVIRNPSA